MKGDIRRIDLRDAVLAGQVLALQRVAYAIEAAMIDLWEIPPLIEWLDELRTSDEQFWGYFVGDVMAGMVATERAEEIVEVARLAVQLAYFRQGIGRALLAYVAYTHRDARLLRVATGSLNAPAVRLYQGFGFIEQWRGEVAPGVWVTHFEMAVPPHGKEGALYDER